MSTKMTIPAGWNRGEPLTVGSREVHHKWVWFVEQPIKLNFTDDIAPDYDAIACIWFHTWEEFERFIKWWNEK